MTTHAKHGSIASPEPAFTYWSSPPVSGRPAWKALEAHHEKVRELHLRWLFADDPGRGHRLTAEGAGVFLDFSKNRITDETWELFDHQPQEYRDSVLPPEVTARVAVEQGSTLGWERYVGPRGHVIGMKTFGASAPLKELQKKFGFEPDRVAAVAKDLLAGR
jgi:hypothetical protein